MKMKQLPEELRDLQYIIDQQTSMYTVSALELYRVFYDEHKAMNGTNKKYIGHTKYEDKMQERYDYVICSINQVIEDYLI